MPCKQAASGLVRETGAFVGFSLFSFLHLGYSRQRGVSKREESERERGRRILQSASSSPSLFSSSCIVRRRVRTRLLAAQEWNATE